MSEVIHLNEENFKANTAGKKCLLDFRAEWCGPCRAFAPILEQIAKEAPQDVLVGDIDIDKNPKLAADFQVRSIPSIFVVAPDGTVLKSYVGVQDKSKLLNDLA